MILLCANVMTPYWGTAKLTADTLEEEWAVNYLANFHLLSILSPALRAQPSDRDVRVLFGTCSSYIGGRLNLEKTESKTERGGQSYARSKLALMTFAKAFQKHLDAYERPDKQANNTRTLMIDPGWSRTPGMRRWLTGGSLLGLLVYLATWPLWWLILKSPQQGAQSFLLAAMDEASGRGAGGPLIKECREVQILKPEVESEDVQQKLWKFSEKQIEQLEKEGAVKRAMAKKEKEKGKDEEKEKQKQKENATHGQNGQATGTDPKHRQGEKGPTPGSRRSRKSKASAD